MVFREGLSGNYLRSLIQDSDQEIDFRIDKTYTSINQSTYTKKYACKCAHLKDIDIKTVHITYHPILTIQVHKKIYHGIYNNFHKKLIVENQDLNADFAHWHNNARFWYDTAYYNIEEYYRLFRKDTEQNTFPKIIDFDHILEIPYIEKIFRQYLDREISDNIRHRITAYARLQLPYDLSGNETQMCDILDIIPDHEFERTPWFAAYCIFKYEMTNQLSDSQRLWSINSIDKPVDKDWLRNISSQYRHI